MSKRHRYRRSRVALARRNTAHQQIVEALREGPSRQRPPRPDYPGELRTVENIRSFADWCVRWSIDVYAARIEIDEKRTAGVTVHQVFQVMTAHGVMFDDAGDVYVSKFYAPLR